MNTPVRRLGPFVVLLPAAFAAGSVAAIEPVDLPQPVTGVAQTVAEAAESAGRDVDADRLLGGATADDDGVQPAASRLLQSLRDGAAATVSQGPPAVVAEDAAAGVAGNPDDRVVFGCPRALLSALLAGAAETGDAVSALAIERETLALCRERQEIVTGIVTLEGELRALLAGSRGETAAPAHSAVVNGGGIMYRRGGVKMYHGLRRELVRVVHGRAPRAGRRALRAAGGGPRVGGACGPTRSSGVIRTAAGVVTGSA